MKYILPIILIFAFASYYFDASKEIVDTNHIINNKIVSWDGGGANGIVIGNSGTASCVMPLANETVATSSTICISVIGGGSGGNNVHDQTH